MRNCNDVHVFLHVSFSDVNVLNTHPSFLRSLFCNQLVLLKVWSESCEYWAWGGNTLWVRHTQPCTFTHLFTPKVANQTTGMFFAATAGDFRGPYFVLLLALVPAPSAHWSVNTCSLFSGSLNHPVLLHCPTNVQIFFIFHLTFKNLCSVLCVMLIRANLNDTFYACINLMNHIRYNLKMNPDACACGLIKAEQKIFFQTFLVHSP